MEKTKKYFKEFFEIMKRKEISILPANLAYFFFISIIPVVTVIIYGATSFSLSFDTVMNFLKETISPSILKILLPILENNSITGSSILIVIIAFLVASNGAHSIIIASNTVFNIKNKNYFYRILKACFITLILIVLFLFLLLVPMFGQSILKLFSYIGFDNQITYAFNILYPVLKYPVSILIVFLLVKMIYTIAPNDKIESRYVNRGALFTTIGWILITEVYAVYINGIALKTYNLYYGSLASIVMLLLWFYLIAYIFVIGLVLNYKNMEEEIDKTNKIKLDEIKEKVKEDREKSLKK